MDAAEVLLQATLFRDLSVPDVEELLPGLHDRSYDRGEAVWHQGDPADVLAVVAEGQLKAHRSHLDGREVIVLVLTAGGTTGEVGLFHPAGTRWFDFTAMTPARVLLIRRAPLAESTTRLEVGDIILDLLRRKVTRADRPVALQPREFAMLELWRREYGVSWG